MPNNPRLLQDSQYVNGNPIPAAYFQGLDSAQDACIDGDAGGAWNPSAPMFVGGAGVWFCGPTFLNSGAVIVTPPGSGARIVHTADVVGLGTQSSPHILSERAILTSCSSAAGLMAPAAQPTETTYALVCAGKGDRFVVPLGVHDRATLTLVAVDFFIVGPYAALPQYLPKVCVFAVDGFGNVTTLGGDPGAGGWTMFPTPANVGAYLGSQTLVVRVPPGLVIDKSKYSYMCEIVDESGTNAAGALYRAVICFFGNIQDLYFE